LKKIFFTSHRIAPTSDKDVRSKKIFVKFLHNNKIDNFAAIFDTTKEKER